jgi:hypothetical protein
LLGRGNTDGIVAPDNVESLRAEFAAVVEERRRRAAVAAERLVATDVDDDGGSPAVKRRRTNRCGDDRFQSVNVLMRSTFEMERKQSV